MQKLDKLCAEIGIQLDQYGDPEKLKPLLIALLKHSVPGFNIRKAAKKKTYMQVREIYEWMDDRFMYPEFKEAVKANTQNKHITFRKYIFRQAAKRFSIRYDQAKETYYELKKLDKNERTRGEIHRYIHLGIKNHNTPAFLTDPGDPSWKNRKPRNENHSY